MKELNAFIRRFSLRDALLRGVSVIGGAFTIAAISLLPGFGISGLITAGAIQLVLSALLELPTSIFADRYGRAKLLLNEPRALFRIPHE